MIFWTFLKATQKVDAFKYLSTDYDNYAIVYECKEKPTGKSVHYLWVSSRTPIMSDSTKTTVDAIIGKYFDQNEVKLIEQNLNICGSRPWIFWEIFLLYSLCIQVWIYYICELIFLNASIKSKIIWEQIKENLLRACI